MTERPPDILVIAMDTVRATDFYGVPGGVTDMPFTAGLFRESIRFPRAVTVAPWTVPAHATIFTGLQPWEHGCHNRRSIRLDASVPRLPELLRPLGYASASLSSNFLIGPELGLVDGFDLAAWGAWWEAYFRVTNRDRPTNSREGASTPMPPPAPARQGLLWSMVRSSAPLFHQYPALMDGPSRLVRRIRYPGLNHEGAVSPWIEPTLRRWLNQTPKEKPVFVFINLLEAHEPYFPGGGDRGMGDWWRFATVRQDRLGWLSGEFDPRPRDMARLKDLYRRSIVALDERLKGIIGAFAESGRWDRTALVLTSDHGQAFGEQGLFFHMLRVDDAEIRIPLWIRPPGGVGGGRDARGWASLADVGPTVLELAGNPYHRFPSSRSLLGLVETERDEPVLCAADGIMSDPMLRGLSSTRRAEFDRPWVGVFEKERKLVLDVDRDQLQAFDVSNDPNEAHDLYPGEADALRPLVEAAREVGRRMSADHREVNSPELEERLRSWGYL